MMNSVIELINVSKSLSVLFVIMEVLFLKCEKTFPIRSVLYEVESVKGPSQEAWL